ncbi:MAG: carbohydrate-binding domain-containing protein, partial [bacterium]
MAFGLARHIPNELTLRNLDLDETEPTEIFASELEEIPEGNPVPHLEYPIGTILKNSETNDEQYYMITPAGEKKLIPDTKTLESLELDISKVKPVPFSKLQGITDDSEPFPHLEYPNGSILKSGDKYYYTTMDKKIELPDEMTLKAHGLDVKPYTISVKAKGTQSGGSFPLIQLRVDGQVVKEWFVTDEYKDYTVTVPLSSGNHKIDVVYPNDQDIYSWLSTWVDKDRSLTGTTYEYYSQILHQTTANRELWIDYIKVGSNNKDSQKIIHAEDLTQVKYDRGSNQNIGGALDNQGVEAGKERMDTAGALRFNVDIDPVINVTKQELEKLDTVMTFDEVKYPNGTVIKNQAGDKIYLMQSGVKQEIKGDKTIEALGIEKDTPILLNTFNFKELNRGKRIYDLTPVSGQWTLTDGVYTQGNITDLAKAKIDGIYSDFIFETKIKAEQTTYPTDCRYINFRVKDEQNQYVLQIFG